MKTKTKRPFDLKALSLARQAMLGHFWDEKLIDPFAFIPKNEKTGRLSLTEARKANELFGKFAATYIRKIIARLTKNSDIRRRQKNDKKIVAVGYGRGYDSKWLRQATRAGLQTWWIDVSSVAWVWAHTNLMNQFQALRRSIPATLHKEPQIRQFEIQSLLANPGRAELDLADVEIWFLCRLLNCLSTRSAKIVLQEIGRTALGSGPDPHKRNAVVVVNALSDDNPTDTGCGGTSIVRSKKMILANLRHGAGRPVESRFVKHYQYFGKLVTAMTIMAQ